MSERLPLVLVVDDDATVRVLMRSALKKAGFDVEVAGTGEEGLRAFEQRRPQMVMLDVELPDLNGHEICRRLRTQAGDSLPIVMVTGRDDVEAVAQAYESGATDFIAKPIHWALFAHRIQYLYRAARAMVELSLLHARTAAVLGAIPDMLLRLDAAGRVLEVHDAGVFTDREMVPVPGQRPFAGCPPEAQRRLAAGLAAALAGAPAQDLAFACVAADGRCFHYEARIARIDQREALCLVRDITERAQAEAALARSESKLEHAQSIARLGSWHVDLVSGTCEWSAQTYRIFGVPEGTPVDNALFFRLLHEDDLQRAQETWKRLQGQAQPFSWEYRIRCGERVVWIVEHGDVELDGLGRALGIAGTVQDITERKEAETRIARLAYSDSLTGLPNRVAFMERLDLEVQRAGQGGHRLALLFMDLDGFKAVNDTLGHLTGDRLLKGAAERLRAVLRDSDVVARPNRPADESATQLARLGGDEFTALLLDAGDADDVLAVTQRVLAALRTPFPVDGHELSMSCSVGVAIYPDDGIDVASLLKHADTAMYHAKEQGRDRCEFYSSALTDRAVERMSLHHDLRLATEQGQFHLAFQPQVQAGDGRLVGVEALLRWTHPVRGAVAPGEFIDLAETTGLIVRIGHWVLNQACAVAATWMHHGRAVRIAVNLSPVQLRHPDLVDNVRKALSRTGLPPGQLELEVTEGALMDDDAATRAALRGLHDLGVRLALDDFGTGYSSMGYLKRMPMHMLKIDRSFVTGLPHDRDSEAIVRAIVSLARSLGFETTAEGVETAEQAAVLRDIGCDLLQGYYFGRPMPAAQMEQRVLGSRPSAALSAAVEMAHPVARLMAVS